MLFCRLCVLLYCMLCVVHCAQYAVPRHIYDTERTQQRTAAHCSSTAHTSAHMPPVCMYACVCVHVCLCVLACVSSFVFGHVLGSGSFSSVLYAKRIQRTVLPSQVLCAVLLCCCVTVLLCAVCCVLCAVLL
jgi:hypothetical protein